MSVTIHLVRHGLTESNRSRRYMGRSDEALSNDGRWQARQLARRLRDMPYAALYSSPLRRAIETAEIVGQPHALAVAVDPGFNELDLERWQGLSATEIERRDQRAWQTWCEAPEKLMLAGIEGLGELQQRVRRALQGLVRRHDDGDIIVVTHDGVVRMAVLESMDMDLRHYRSMPIDNTSLTILELGGRRTYLRSLNDTGHLPVTTPDRDHNRGPADS